MPLLLAAGHPSVIIRRAAFERTGIARSTIDQRLGLTDEEFRVEGDLIVIGPVLQSGGLTDLIAEFEDAGLVYYEDFFDLSGNWPDWLVLFAKDA